MRNKVGILFQPMSKAAGEMAVKLERIIADLGASVWVCSSWDEDRARELTDGTELVVCLGGDGTILRAARIVDGKEIPIVGVNLGRLGFMTELGAADALSRITDFVGDNGYMEERTMLQASMAGPGGGTYHALNDVVVGRAGKARLVRVAASVDGERVTIYKADGVIVATATGSTGYALAAGGPILHPEGRELLLQPIAAHMSLSRTLVLPPDSRIELEVSTTHGASLTVDGQIEVPLEDGSIVSVQRSPRVTRMLRGSRPRFYETLIKKLAVPE
ncbi:MAG: NAD(+)/NADH kinase [Dehalococcoidia bacterium]|nr:NAD(+)/NADH kinase [Dehalococcoidia bacterium]